MATLNTTIAKTVAMILKNVSPRNRDVISRRFGLKKGKKETLESIGQSYGITRERVRQIEEFSLVQLTKAVQGDPEIEKYAILARDILIQNGGVIKERELFKSFSGSDKENVANASLVFVLSLAKEPIRFGDSDSLRSFWAVSGEYADSFKSLVSKVLELFNKSQTPIAQSQFTSFVRENNSSHQNFAEKYVDNVLNICKEVGKNVFGEIGLVHWSEVKPKGVRDKAYLVLKKERNPKHFSEITKLINATGFSDRKANNQTVHNELIKDSRFVLVGRGLYGLSEWGYKPGTVKDVLVSILEEYGKPLAKAELISKVMDNRLVKENTILLNLQNSKVFRKNEDGTYTLRKA